MFKIVLLVLISLFFNSCNSPYDKPLKIATNSWIGYAPLFYAHDKGWLKAYNIDVVNVVSLAESMYIYGANNADAFTGTQFEYKITKEQYDTLFPVMLFDQSFGGDLILGNRPLEALQKNDKMIDAYLELDSVNSVLLDDFIAYYRINEDKLHYINQDQERISELKNTQTMPPSLIVTYSPYNIKLKKQGFEMLASTRDGRSIIVVDGLYASKETYLEHEDQFKILKEQTDKAIEVLHNDPREFYAHVKEFLGGMSYHDFQESLDHIKWINKAIPPAVTEKLKKIDYPIDGVI